MNVFEVYTGSDGHRTTDLYERLTAMGPIGIVALNLFRAQKCSERAKVYRRAVHRESAYGRKQWSMDNLCKALQQHAGLLLIPWGWKEDPGQEFHKWVLYVDLPNGQMSFHTERRGQGPDYDGEWDGVKGMCGQRVVSFCQKLFPESVCKSS